MNTFATNWVRVNEPDGAVDACALENANASTPHAPAHCAGEKRVCNPHTIAALGPVTLVRAGNPPGARAPSSAEAG